MDDLITLLCFPIVLAAVVGFAGLICAVGDRIAARRG